MKKYTLASLLFIAFVLIFGGSASAKEPIDAIKANVKKRTEQVQKEVPSISVQDFKKMLDEGQVFAEIIDVRGADEYAAGHLADAINIPRGKTEWVVPKKITDPGQKIYVYCKTGARGAHVVKMLKEVGYKDVTNVKGGFKTWASAGYPFYNMHGENVIVKDGFDKKP